MKPGMSRNIENPEMSVMQAEANAAQVGMGSNQTPMTVQTWNRNPNRLRPAYGGSSTGKADVEVSGVMDNQTSDFSSSTRTTYSNRKRLY
jgi:hypothetical protein